MFSKKVNSYKNGGINHYNLRYCIDRNPHWFTDSKIQSAGKQMIWCGHIIAFLLIKGNLNSFLSELIMLNVLNEVDLFPKWYQQIRAREWPNK